jgi:Ca2+:H+ antiporter
MKFLYAMGALAPVAVVGSLLGWSPAIVLILSSLAMIPMAGLLGRATEELSAHTGPRVGGLLNATLGNAAELIIAIFAIHRGLLDLVKASITGSIIGNVLLVLGLSIVVGGLRNGTQKFNRDHASIQATSMFLAVIALVVPSIFGHTIDETNHNAVEYLSIGVAIAMIAIYLLGLVYALLGRNRQEEESHAAKATWSTRRAALWLLGSAAVVAVLSEVLVASVEPAIQSLGISEFFVGIVLIPLVGNAAEHLVAVQSAWKNHMELSLSVSLGSSLQVALLVAPLLVFTSLAMGNPLTLAFNQFELIALAGAVLIASMAASDGQSNWMEGAQLLAVYVILSLAFFFLPT